MKLSSNHSSPIVTAHEEVGVGSAAGSYDPSEYTCTVCGGCSVPHPRHRSCLMCTSAPSGSLIARHAVRGCDRTSRSVSGGACSSCCRLPLILRDRSATCSDHCSMVTASCAARDSLVWLSSRGMGVASSTTDGSLHTHRMPTRPSLPHLESVELMRRNSSLTLTQHSIHDGSKRCSDNATALWLSSRGDCAACLMQPMMSRSHWCIHSLVPTPCT